MDILIKFGDKQKYIKNVGKKWEKNDLNHIFGKKYKENYILIDYEGNDVIEGDAVVWKPYTLELNPRGKLRELGYKITKNEFIECKNLDHIKLFLRYGVDINMQNGEGSTILMNSTDLDIIKFLVKHGAKVNIKDGLDRTALHHSESLDIVKYLIERGADINAQDISGATPLDCAEDKDIKEFLMSKGAIVGKKHGDLCMLMIYPSDDSEGLL